MKRISLTIFNLLLLLQLVAQTVTWRIDNSAFIFLDYNDEGNQAMFILDSGDMSEVSPVLEIEQIGSKEFLKFEIPIEYHNYFKCIDLTRSQSILVSKDESLGLNIYTETLDPIKTLLPFIKQGNLVIDLFMVSDYNDFPNYGKLLVLNGVDTSTICMSIFDLVKNPLQYKYLSLVDNDIAGGFNYKIPNSHAKIISKAKNLEKIMIKGIEFKVLPSKWGSLDKLSDLIIINSGLEKIKTDFSKLHNLKNLVLDDNWLESLKINGVGIENLSASNNYIKKVELGRSVYNMNSIDLSENVIKKFVLKSTSYENLKILNLSDNNLSKLFLDSRFPRLKSLIINGNPIEGIDLSVTEHLIELGIDDLITSECFVCNQIEHLITDKLSDNFDIRDFESLKSLTILSPFIESRKYLDYNHLGNLNKLTVNNILSSDLYDISNYTDIKHLSFLETNFDKIVRLRFKQPKLHISYVHNGALFNSPKLNEKKINMLYTNSNVDFYKFNVLLNRKEIWLAFNISQRMSENNVISSINKDELIDFRLKRIILAEKIFPDYIEDLDVDNIYNSVPLKYWEDLYSTVSSIDETNLQYYNLSEEKAANLRELSRKKCYSIYYSLFNELRNNNKELLVNSKYLDYKASNIKKSGSVVKEVGNTLSNLSSYSADLQSIDNTRLYTSSDAGVLNDYAGELAVAGLALEGVGVIVDIFAEDKSRKAEEKRIESEKLIAELDKLEKKLIKYVKNEEP